MDVNQKINDLELQLRNMQSELDMLKRYVHNANEDVSTIKPIPNISVPKQNSPKQAAPKESIFKESISQKTSSSSNLEKIFGKYLMGIAASVLIFIGLIFLVFLSTVTLRIR